MITPILATNHSISQYANKSKKWNIPILATQHSIIQYANKSKNGISPYWQHSIVSTNMRTREKKNGMSPYWQHSTVLANIGIRVRKRNIHILATQRSINQYGNKVKKMEYPHTGNTA